MTPKLSRLAALVGFSALASSVPAAAAPPTDLDAYVARALQTFGAPGMSVAVVEDGRVAVAKGYGVRKLGSPEPADARTSFPIGSETKAITAAAPRGSGGRRQAEVERPGGRPPARVRDVRPIRHGAHDGA